MLNSVKAVAYRVPDLDRAKRWYGEILGTAPIFDSRIVVMFKVGEAVLSLAPAAETPPLNDPQAIAAAAQAFAERLRTKVYGLAA